MDLKINYEEINKNIRKFEDEYDLLYFIKDNLEYLSTHNKNYNQSQWIMIQDLKEIFNNVSIREK